ncbi:KICSTOR complex protein szt2 [Entomortierella lignicola]|nr:KICSTOR complex protein szt2 [Entomortierella lignicola]
MNVKQAEEISQVDKVEALYIPYWAASGSVKSKIINAQVGWDRVVTRYNKVTKQNESSWETTWKSIQTQHEFLHTYPSTIPELQIYASYKYRRGFVNQIRSSTSILDAKSLEPQDMESTNTEDIQHGLTNRGLDPFTMKPSIALKFVKTAIEDSEVQRAERWLIDNYRCDQARIMSMDFQYSGLILAPVYMPVFVFSVQHLDRTFRTFVQAHDETGLVGGLRFYSWQRVSAVTAIFAAASLTVLGTSRFGMTMTTGFWLGVVAPSLVVAWSVLYYPILDYRIRDWWRQREKAGHEAEASHSTWDTDWTKAYDRYEEEQRRQDWSENQQYYRQSSQGSRTSSSTPQSGPPGDPHGYYATLGVQKNASVQEIQSAFRGLAMKWPNSGTADYENSDPDRFSTPEEKAKGKKKFQEITAAYNVLRDTKKRRAYDIYYFQEDSDESPNCMQPEASLHNDGNSTNDDNIILDDSDGNASQQSSLSQRQERVTVDQPRWTFGVQSPSGSVSSSSVSSLSPSTDPNAVSPNAKVITDDNARQSPNSTSSRTTAASSEQLKKISTLKELGSPQENLMEDAKSLAIAIENQDMMSRADLEETLLRNLFAPVKSLESEELTSGIPVPYSLTKCLSGLSDGFSCPGMEQNFVKPEIHITVIAECSQFASNSYTGDMLANFPTMKVLLQDVILTESNLYNVLKVLRVQLAKFQTKLSRFRGELRRAREKLGYSLAVEDVVDDINAELDAEDDISQRKSWGVGLSGANMSYTLTAGLFALNMMPSTASPSLVIITDGVVKSNLLHGSTILRRFMELDVSCSIVQLGNQVESIPSCNWGFVQDTEMLRFVAEATLGKFMYSQDCPSVDPSNKARGSVENRVAPNIYHRAFLIRELCLLKPRPGLDDIDERDDSAGYSLANFPWDPKSLPQPIKMMQTACKDYHINIPVEKLVTTRIRQGFRIKGVSVAPDRERPSSERYMITMTLAWLPNVTVQYRLKGQVSGASPNSGYLSRFEFPKVEIDIIAYQAFAIHFLNSQHAPYNANHSVYAKVLRIHRYIVGLSDSDVTLRGLSISHASANQALWTQRAKRKEQSRLPISGTTSQEQEIEDMNTYISRLSVHWSGLAKDAYDQYSRGWYNEHEFDFLLVVPPPAFLPTNMDTKNSLIKYAEELATTIKGIKDVLKTTWASFTVGDVLIKSCQSIEPSPSTTASWQFVELRLFSEPNVSVLRAQLRFFGVPVSERRSIIKDLQEKIYSFQADQSEQCGGSKSEPEIVPVKVLPCRRPIYRLLMRHLIHEAPLSYTPESTLTDFHTHVSEPIGEESVLRSYLVHKHWGWKDQVRDSAYLSENKYMASQDLAFQYLCAQRIGEGFHLASTLPNRIVFYKEIDLSGQTESLLKGPTTAQYLIFRSPVSGELVTELWMEPSLDACHHNMFDKTKAQIIAVDRFVMSRLATYEAIHTIGRLRLRPEVNVQPERGFMYPWLFDPATLLRQQRMITLAFEAAHRSSQSKDDHDQESERYKRCVHTLSLGTTYLAEGTSNAFTIASNSNKEALMTKNFNASTTSLSQSLLETEVPAQNENDLMTEYKDQLRELCCTERDLALLHLFMEKSLSQLADGEIMPGSEDDACTQFFMDIKSSIKRNPEVRQTLMTFHCASSFQDIRCFVKNFNARFFRLIIVPRLGSVISHLLKLRSLPPREHEIRSGQARQDFLSCFMFECLRSKPLADISEHNANALDQSYDLIELHPVPIGPTVMQQPLLLQPIVNEDQGNARVQESTMQLIRSISQAYSHSFAKAIYASLIEGHTVDSSDLKKACQICTRTTVDINITGFLNTLEQGRRIGMIRDESSELLTRFMTVLKHSFELAPVAGSDKTYFYRPILRKLIPKQTKPKSRKRSPSVSRSGSVDAEIEDALAEVIESAERPLFLHLECSFQKPLTPASELDRAGLKSLVTFPVNELPVSYIYNDKDSQEYDYAPTDIGLDLRPVDSVDGTVAILHLVISTLPMPEDYAGPTLKTIDSDTKSVVDNSQHTGSRSLHHLFPTLDSTQAEAIAETEARLEWLVKEEVMHGLLNMAPVTIDILNLVETQLKTKSNFVNFPTAMTLPLTFAKKKRGHEIFMQELGRTNMHPYQLHQVEQHFYLTEGEDTMEEDESMYKADSELGGEAIASTESDDLPSLSSNFEKDHSLPPSSDLCHGLGIVILPDPKPVQKSDPGQKASNDPRQSKKKRSFWLILVPKDTFVQIYFFSKALSEEACNTILDHVRKAISDLCIKVNQLTLLQSLNETRVCSMYLVPSEDTDPNADSESGSESDQLSQDDEALVASDSRTADAKLAAQKKFKPGEFACPLVHRVAWPLHWRVKAGQATKSVAHVVLYQFAVSNRKNFFVVESQDDYDESKKIVVYLRLSEVEVQPEQESAIHTSDDPRGAHLATSKTEDSTGPIYYSNHNLEDAGSHGNSPRPSPTASPGSKIVATPVIRTDTRELVIEVYGVEPPGKKVTVELFSMLENRFYNSVVLPAVATFLSRNTALKLTQADVEFILPVDRLEPARQILEIPHFINVPFAFLMYLKQNLSLYLNPLTGTDKVGILTRYYQTRYDRSSMSEKHDRGSHSHQLQIGDFSFFYNAVQGRMLTPIELQVGLGVAGVCLTVLGQDARPVFEVGHQEGDRDKEDIERYFASFPSSSGLKPSKYSLMIEVWAQGNVNASALLDAICQSFRQSLCDDVIETSINQGISARDRKSDVCELDGEPLIGERIQKNFIDPSFMVLQQSYELKNPAVQSLALEYSMPPWIMDSFLLELDEIMTDVTVHFSPLLIRSMADSNRYKEYKASSGTRKSFDDMTNIRFIMIGGIQDLGDGSSSNSYVRRTSMGSERTHSRRSSLAEGQSLHHSHKTSTHSSQLLPKRQLEDVKMFSDAPTGQDEYLLRNCFVVITINGFGLQAYTYNWGKTYHEFMFSAIEKVVRWHRDRMRLLDNILLQKMGLFHHVPSVLCTAPAPNTLAAVPPTPAITTPSVAHGLPRIVPQGSPHLGSNLRIAHVEPPVSVTSNITKTANISPKTQTTSIALSETTNLASLVEDQFPSRTRSFHGSSLYGNEDNRPDPAKAPVNTLYTSTRPSSSTQTPAHLQGQSQAVDQSSSVASAVISAGLDVDQILREHCLEPLETQRDEDQVQDEVQRHGKPFLETFASHTKNVEDQQNAYNVYQKWSRRYRDRKGAPNALHENMNTSDLAIMLRSSRLLHFCRTPLLFTEFSSSLFQLAKDSPAPAAQSGSNQPAAGVKAESASKGLGESTSSVDPVTQWYSALAETFMREYSQYLVTVGMQLLMYGNSKFDKPVEVSQSEELSFMSQFTVSQTLSVLSPAAFLFKSLQGGSIMCEVRLQGMFVCVTLYTLNRRYGRIKVAAPGFATAEANKQSLRLFTEQCAKFKDRIHVNSFVYDFHLRYIHKILMESSKVDVPATQNADSSPTCPSSNSLPFSFDLLDVLHQFLQYHSRPAAYSRNRVYRGVYRANVAPGETELPGHLFEYMIKNPKRYGFQAIQYQNRPRACFISGQDLLSGFGGKPRNLDDNFRFEHHRAAHEGSGQNLKGFGVGTNRGGLPPNNDKRSFGAHTRHTSHDSNLNVKRISRRMTNSRSSHTMKEATILEEEGVEYILVISDGEQDSTGLTVHYYLIILREEEVVKRLEERHGPLLGSRDCVLAGGRTPKISRGNFSTSSSSHGTPGMESRASFTVNQFQQLQSLGDDGAQVDPKQPPSRPDNDLEKSDVSSQETSGGGEKFMDATELQERITEQAVLGDVVRAAEVRLDLMLKQAAQFFDRDSLWEMLLQGKIGNSGIILTGSNNSLVGVQHNVGTPGTMLSIDTTDYMSHNTSTSASTTNQQQQAQSNTHRDNIPPSSAELGFADFLALGQRFHSTPLEEMEPGFRDVIVAPGIDWDEGLTFLARYYTRWAREFVEHDETNLPGPAVSSLRLRQPHSTISRRGSLVPNLKPQRARRHLVIFNPHNRDLLVHFVININTSRSKEGLSQNRDHGTISRQYDIRRGALMRTSGGDLYSKLNQQDSEEPSPMKLKLYSQSQSQLQTLLLNSSLPNSPSVDQQQQQQQQQQHQAQTSLDSRPSLSEASSRVSSMTSIARAATLAVSKVASRLQSRSREPSINTQVNYQSGTSSRATSVLMPEDDTQSVMTSTTSATGHGESGKASSIHMVKSGTGTGSSSLLGPEIQAMRRTRKVSGTSISSQSQNRRRLGLGLGLGLEGRPKSLRERQSTAGSEMPGEQYSENNSLIDSETHRDIDSEDLDKSNNVSVMAENESEQDQYDNEDDENEDQVEDMDQDEDEDDEFDEIGANVRVFSVSREPKSGYNEVETEHVGDIIRTLSYWIWRAQK